MQITKYSDMSGVEKGEYCRTEAESKQSPQPKPNIINRPQDLSKLGWTPLEIDELIHKKNFFPNSTAPASH